MRCILLDKTLTIAAPYRGDPGRPWMTEWLRSRFKSIFGIDFPMLKVLSNGRIV